MTRIAVDAYVLDVLLRDLVGHDHSPSAFIVFLHLWTKTFGEGARTARLSHRMLAEATGLSKSAVQAAVRLLVRRRLLRMHLATRTAVPEYTVLRPWLRP